jgi:peroxiredoxin
VDIADGTLLKYRGQARLAQPDTVYEITTVLQRTAVHSVAAADTVSRERQARVLSDIGLFLDANPVPGRAQVPEFEEMQQRLTALRDSNPGSPYQPVCSTLQEHLARQLKVIRRDQQQSDCLGKPAPEFALRDVDGKPYALKELRGHVVLLNFCASWCGPCNEEAPRLEHEFWRRFQKRGLIVLGIDTREEGQSLIRGRAFRDSHQLTYPMLADTADSVSRAYQVQAIPVNVVIDGDGIVRYVATGFEPDSLTVAINSLLKP